MTTPLEKTLKRELTIDGRAFIVAISPDGLKLTLKGKRLGQELRWKDLVSGDAALAVALNASLGGFAAPAAKSPIPEPREPRPQQASPRTKQAPPKAQQPAKAEQPPTIANQPPTTKLTSPRSARKKRARGRR